MTDAYKLIADMICNSIDGKREIHINHSIKWKGVK